MALFNEKYIRVEDLIVSLAIMTTLRGTRDEYFKSSLSKSQLKTMSDLRLLVEKYINFEEALRAVDNLDRSDLGADIKSKTRPTSSLFSPTPSLEKRPVEQRRADQKIPKFDS